MKGFATLLLCVLCVSLAGCASQGCSGYACKRPEANSRQLVIWWPPEMRQGLDEQDHEQDYSLVPLRD
jgi:hypothetical protein